MLGERSGWRVVSTDPNVVKSASLQFLDQQNCLLAIKLFCRLTRSIQKHRGASIACLDGDIKFTPVVLSLQAQIVQYLEAISLFNMQHTGLLDAASLNNIKGEWATIEEGWQKDHVVQNYEFHCHLLEQIRKSIRYLLGDYLMTPLSKDETVFRQDFEASFIAITDTIELLAKLRGLVTHVASLKAKNNDLYIRMEFILRTIPQESAGLYHILQEKSTASLKVSGLNHLALQQNRVRSLLDNIQKTIVDSDEVSADAETLFDQATTIIDTYWNILDQSIVAMEDCIYDSFSMT